MRWEFTIFGVITCLSGCAQPQLSQPASAKAVVENIWPGRKADVPNILDVVVRYQFDHNLSDVQKKPAVYFLGISKRGLDPSDEFITRFSGSSPLIKKASEYREVEGREFRIEDLEWFGDDIVDVSATFYGGPRHNYGLTGGKYRVVRRGSSWLVQKYFDSWIS